MSAQVPSDESLSARVKMLEMRVANIEGLLTHIFDILGAAGAVFTVSRANVVPPPQGRTPDGSG